jgi:serine/threonine-protein kinase
MQRLSDLANGPGGQPGYVIADRYRLMRLIGRGGMGEVWLAHHQTLREELAIKLLTIAASDDDPIAAAKRFRFEAQVAARLSRKTRHIVRVTDHGESDGFTYLAMELLEGRTLDATLLLRDGLPEGDVRKIVAQIARALEHAHAEGVVHRDLKPSNVFLTHDEDGELLVKVLDFGIARVVHSHLAVVPFTTGSGIVFGTPGYMGPEQAAGQAGLDQRCDLWALATVAYEALTNELPVNGASAGELLQNVCARQLVPVRERRANLPKGLDAFFERAFAENVDARFATARELAEAFENAFREAPEPVAPREPMSATLRSHYDTGSSRPRPRSLRRRATQVGAVIGACGLLLTAWPRHRSSVLAPSPAAAAAEAAVAPVEGPFATAPSASASPAQSPAESAIADPLAPRALPLPRVVRTAAVVVTRSAPGRPTAHSPSLDAATLVGPSSGSVPAPTPASAGSAAPAAVDRSSVL